MKTFYVGIKGVIVKDGKALILRTNHERGQRWEMPGGRIEDDESIEQTLQRELQEELPNIRDIKLHGVLGAHRLHKDIEGDKSLILIFYRVEATFDGDPQLSDEHIEWQWADRAKVLKLVGDIGKDVIVKAFAIDPELA